MKPLLLIFAAAMAAAYDAETVQCQDKEFTCPDRNTCCPLSPPNEGYGCCPMPNAVCCEDRIHCCPHGTVCDVKQGRCKDKTLDMVRII